MYSGRFQLPGNNIKAHAVVTPIASYISCNHTGSMQQARFRSPTADCHIYTLYRNPRYNQVQYTINSSKTPVSPYITTG
jgi:hypothetical protein